MIRIVDQFDVGQNTLLILDSPVPLKLFTKLLIDGKEYEPLVVYDLENGIGIPTHGFYKNKEIIFL